VTIWFGLRVVSLFEGMDGETCRTREVPTMRVCPDTGEGVGADGGGGSGVTWTFLARTYPSLPLAVLTLAHDPSMLSTVTCHPLNIVTMRWEEAVGAARRLLTAVRVERGLEGAGVAGVLGSDADNEEMVSPRLRSEANEECEEDAPAEEAEEEKTVVVGMVLRPPPPPPPPPVVVVVVEEPFTSWVRILEVLAR
jgi:sec-independent protein translocase protein TatA